MIRPHFPALLLAAAASLAGAAPGHAHDLRLTGKVELRADGGKPVKAAELRNTVVFFEPEQKAAPKPPPAAVQMVTKNKEFEPRVLIVTTGTKVAFPNQDPILHNVFSLSGDNKFDLGLYRKGPGKTWLFEHPGIVRVFCNVHHSMVAYVLVLDTPFHTTPRDDGSFAFEGLSAGPGKLTVWHERSEPWSESVTLPRAQPLVARLEMTRPRVPAHLNKLGKAYQRSSRGQEYR